MNGGWGVQNALTRKNVLLPLNFFENIKWGYEPLINSRFDEPIVQIYIFIRLVSASVLFEGVFSLWVSLINNVEE